MACRKAADRCKLEQGRFRRPEASLRPTSCWPKARVSYHKAVLLSYTSQSKGPRHGIGLNLGPGNWCRAAQHIGGCCRWITTGKAFGQQTQVIPAARWIRLNHRAGNTRGRWQRLTCTRPPTTDLWRSCKTGSSSRAACLIQAPTSVAPPFRIYRVKPAMTCSTVCG